MEPLGGDSRARSRPLPHGQIQTLSLLLWSRTPVSPRPFGSRTSQEGAVPGLPWPGACGCSRWQTESRSPSPAVQVGAWAVATWAAAGTGDGWGVPSLPADVMSSLEQRGLWYKATVQTIN